MPNLVDLTGRRFGRLTAMWPSGSGLVGRQRKTFWLFACDCGKLHLSVMGNVSGGTTQSCGCLQREIRSSAHFKHGQATSDEARTTEYNTWCSMLGRCGNPKKKDWKNYGGRGIKVCERWHSFENFFSDMGKKPNPRLTIERMDNDGNYEPGNCKWATYEEQAANRRKRKCLKEN
jgi:hypothetical protein